MERTLPWKSELDSRTGLQYSNYLFGKGCFQLGTNEALAWVAYEYLLLSLWEIWIGELFHFRKYR